MTFFERVLSVYRRRLPENGYFSDNKPFLEIFHYKKDSNHISMDFCIPVIPYQLFSMGLPVGIQIVGKRWSDLNLLFIAEELAKFAEPIGNPPSV